LQESEVSIRHRDKPVGVETDVIFYQQNGSGILYNYSYGYLDYGTQYVEITDSTARCNPSSPGRYGVKPLDHWSVEVLGSVPGSRPNFGWPGEAFVLHSRPQLRLNRVSLAARGFDNWRFLLPQLDGGTIASLATDARIAFAEQMPQELSIPNFLYEFGETKDLVEGFGDLAVGLLNKLKASGVRKGTDKSLQELTGIGSKGAAGLYLGNEFGVLPLIGDLEKLAGLVTTVFKRIDQLKRTWGKEVKLTKRFGGLMPLPAIRDEVPVNQGGFIEPLASYNGFLYPRFRNTDIEYFGRLTHRLEGLDSVWGKVRAFLAATGFNNPLKVVWETVPFSFVIDWVSNIGNLFDGITAQPFQGQWDVYDVGYTVTQHAVYDLRLEAPAYIGDQSYGKVGTVGVFHKMRRPGFPEPMLTFNLAGLSPKQLSLSMALLRSVY
jgi:hypothetical protein